MSKKREGMRIEAETRSITNKECIMNAIERHCKIVMEKEQYTVRSNIKTEYSDGYIIKFEIENKHEHKVVLYASSLDELIKTLEELRAKLTQDVRLGEKVDK